MQQPPVSTNQAFPASLTQSYFQSQQTNAGNGAPFYQQGSVQYQANPIYYSYPPPTCPRPVVPQAIPQDDPDSHKEAPATSGNRMLSNLGSKVIDAYGSVLVIIGWVFYLEKCQQWGATANFVYDRTIKDEAGV